MIERFMLRHLLIFKIQLINIQSIRHKYIIAYEDNSIRFGGGFDTIEFKNERSTVAARCIAPVLCNLLLVLGSKGPGWGQAYITSC
jgi:hypothetical protein